MLLHFSVENFRSIRDAQVLSMIAKRRDDSLPQQIIHSTAHAVSNTEILRQVAIYGANASGKSNIIKAIAALRDIVVNAFREGPDSELPISPFALESEWVQKPTRFELMFLIEDTQYSYILAATAKRIEYEELAIREGSERPKTLFERRVVDNKGTEAWKVHESIESINADILSKLTRANVPAISLMAQIKVERVLPIFRWFERGIVILDYSANVPLKRGEWVDTAHEVHRNPAVREFVASMLRASDLGIADVRVERDVEEESKAKSLYPQNKIMPSHIANRVFDVTFLHKGSESTSIAEIDLRDESAGTQRLFSLLAPWARAILHNQLLIVDEIDASIHPSMVRHLIQGFATLCGSDKTGQAIYTTHDVTLMDRRVLRRDQILLTEKNKAGATRVIPLTDYSPRKGEAIEANYMSGAYGGVPILDDFSSLPANAFPVTEE